MLASFGFAALGSATFIKTRQTQQLKDRSNSLKMGEKQPYEV